jgi:hypothetical protein
MFHDFVELLRILTHLTMQLVYIRYLLPVHVALFAPVASAAVVLHTPHGKALSFNVFIGKRVHDSYHDYSYLSTQL